MERENAVSKRGWANYAPLFSTFMGRFAREKWEVILGEKMAAAPDRRRMKGNGLMSAWEVGEVLGLSAETVRRMAADGRLASVKVPYGAKGKVSVKFLPDVVKEKREKGWI